MVIGRQCLLDVMCGGCCYFWTSCSSLCVFFKVHCIACTWSLYPSPLIALLVANRAEHNYFNYPQLVPFSIFHFFIPRLLFFLFVLSRFAFFFLLYQFLFIAILFFIFPPRREVSNSPTKHTERERERNCHNLAFSAVVVARANWVWVLRFGVNRI